MVRLDRWRRNVQGVLAACQTSHSNLKPYIPPRLYPQTFLLSNLYSLKTIDKMSQNVQKYIINKRKGFINKRKPEEKVCYYIGSFGYTYPCPAAESLTG